MEEVVRGAMTKHGGASKIGANELLEAVSPGQMRGRVAAIIAAEMSH